jgi:hypothetical protein
MAAFDTVIRHGAIARRSLGRKGYGRCLGRARASAPLSMLPHRWAIFAGSSPRSNSRTRVSRNTR